MTDQQIFSSVKAGINHICQILYARLEATIIQGAFDESLLHIDFIAEFPDSPLYHFKKHYTLSDEEFILILILLTAEADPGFIDRQVSLVFKTMDINIPELGAAKRKNGQSLLPTIQTCYFIITGNNLEKNLELKPLFEPGKLFRNHFIVELTDPEPGEPFNHCRISLTDVYVELFTTGTTSIPPFGSGFPAERITTGLEWNDLVLPDDCMKALTEMGNWLRHGHLLYEAGKQGGQVNTGFKALFHGPAGTGKSMTAALLSKQFGLDLYRIDCNLLVATETGEALKIVHKLIYLAETKGWMLFFDKQTTRMIEKIAMQTHDETAHKPALLYLWQAIEQYGGISIFETDDVGKLEAGFLGLFQSQVRFLIPGAADRERIWKQQIPYDHQLEPAIDLAAISKKYVLTGLQIQQVIQKIILQAAVKHEKRITAAVMQEVLDKLPATDAAGGTTHKKEIKIFVSYSSRDSELKNLITDRLNAHLKNKPGIKYILWDDKEIDVGADWRAEIDAALEQSQIALLLVSASFAASAFIMENEVASFFNQKNGRGYLSIPVLVRNYNFHDFEELSRLQFFKAKYKDYGFDKHALRNELMPFDVLGDNGQATDKQIEDYFRNLSDHIHRSVSNYFR